MNEPVVVSSSWKGLFVVLAVAVLGIGGLVAGWRYLSGQAAATEARIRTEFITPYFEALKAGDAARAWRDLTTESYRTRHKQADFLANAAIILAAYGKPATVKIVTVTATSEPGRSFQRVRTDWTWEKGAPLTRIFQLVDVPHSGYRMDGATIDGLSLRVVPDAVAAGPW